MTIPKITPAHNDPSRRHTRSPGFPEPLARLIGMTVWDADEVDEWARHNRPPRPTDGDDEA
ncbi:hypothetical protein [Micromonospora sp. CA-246542]|uniref:hypothetical protein n=1 Tax=Micromonospora sp. CA-246542 TaxID=3239959 RepID=UPI003D8EE6D3